MKKIICSTATVLFLLACNNKAKSPAVDAPPAVQTAPGEENKNNDIAPSSSGENLILNFEGKELKLNGSTLVDKDKKKLRAGAPYRAMITSSSGPDNEGLILRFVFDTKPGTYPLTGMSFGRGKGDNDQQFGGLLGGEEKLYDASVNLTEVKDLGDNGAGGHKWSIGGTVENLTIPAMGLMLMDKTKNHPKEIRIDKVSFTDIRFDDNAEEMLQKAMEQLKEMKKK